MPSRFDLALMTPPVPGGPPDAELLRRVRTWCEASAFTPMRLPLAVARTAPHAALDAVACELDGSHRLARLGRVRGLAWRLQVVLQDRWPGRGAQAEDPWDCGWWRDGALDAAAAFRPRRATLLLLRDPVAPALEALLATLRAASPAYGRPLRVLVVSKATGSGLARL